MIRFEKTNRHPSQKTVKHYRVPLARGFTLIELLIVIGILAVLATTVVLVLNPAQILAQARDSQRLSDLNSVKSAIALYLSTADTPTVGVGPTCTATGCDGAGKPFVDAITVSTSTAVNGTGWVLIALTNTSGGSSLAALPLDPTNSGNYFYAYKGDDTNKTFELDTRLESSKFRDMMQTDGGNKNTCSTYVESTCFYEVGTEPGLDL